MTAISFSFSEKLIFDLGMLLPLALHRQVREPELLRHRRMVHRLSRYQFVQPREFRVEARQFQSFPRKVITSTTYHSLHHSRYTGNYGLGTRALDRLLKTEWPDYEIVYDKVSTDRNPLKKLKERFDPAPTS